MEIFLSLIIKIIPLYILVILGFIAGKIYKIDKECIAKLTVFFLTPAVVFIGTSTADLNQNLILLPLIFLTIAIIICSLSLFFGKYVFKDSTLNLFAFGSSSGNTGYFGLPVCIALLGEKSIPIAVMLVFGLTIFENTLGYYIFARSKFTIKESLRKILILPSIYAFTFGVICNMFSIDIPNLISDTALLLKNAYSTLGMMIIGLGLSTIQIHHIDKKLIFLTSFNKIFLWLIAAIFIIYVDKNYLHLFNQSIYKVLIIESIVPVAANTVSYASIFKSHPEKAAIAVFISTLIALILIPFILSLLPLFQ